MSELEAERERRWKTERQCKALNEELRQLQEQEEAERLTMDRSQQVSARVKAALLAEQQAKLQLQADVERLQVGAVTAISRCRCNASNVRC